MIKKKTAGKLLTFASLILLASAVLPGTLAFAQVPADGTSTPSTGTPSTSTPSTGAGGDNTKLPDVVKLPTSGNTQVTYTCGKDGSGKDIVTSIDFGSTSKLCTGTGASPVTAMILWVVGFLSVGVGIAVVVGISLGGLAYITSDGDAGKAKKGQDIIMNSIIGLFLFVFLWAAINFLVPGGMFK